MDLIAIPPLDVLISQQIAVDMLPEGWPKIKVKHDDELDEEGAAALPSAPAGPASGSSAAGVPAAMAAGVPGESDVESGSGVASESD